MFHTCNAIMAYKKKSIVDIPVDDKERSENDSLWSTFAQQASISVHQLQLFKAYTAFLLQENEKYNLTAIEDVDNIADYHFLDSLALEAFVDMSKIQAIADVGSGAGFPGIPLKIKYPHLFVNLIEVNEKKRFFLQSVVDILELDDIVISGYDWRTFLRKNEIKIDLFCARASLKPEELLRVFSPACRYNNTCLVYWASKQWEPTEKEKVYGAHSHFYSVGKKERKLVFFFQNLPPFYKKGEL